MILHAVGCRAFATDQKFNAPESSIICKSGLHKRPLVPFDTIAPVFQHVCRLLFVYETGCRELTINAFCAGSDMSVSYKFSKECSPL